MTECVTRPPSLGVCVPVMYELSVYIRVFIIYQSFAAKTGQSIMIPPMGQRGKINAGMRESSTRVARGRGPLQKREPPRNNFSRQTV